MTKNIHIVALFLVIVTFGNCSSSPELGDSTLLLKNTLESSIVELKLSQLSQKNLNSDDPTRLTNFLGGLFKAVDIPAPLDIKDCVAGQESIWISFITMLVVKGSTLTVDNLDSWLTIIKDFTKKIP